MGAAIAYYTTFSLAPLLIIVLGVAGIFLGAEAASGYLYRELSGLLGDAGARTVQGLVQSVDLSGKGPIATIVGVVLLLIGATTVFAELQDDLDRIWKVPPAPSSGLWNLLRGRLLSLGLVVSIGFLLLVSLVLSAAVTAFGRWWGDAYVDTAYVLRLGDAALGLAVATILFALMYKILPRARIAWRDVWTGAFVTAVLFTIGKIAVGAYLGRSAVASAFGAAGSLAVLMAWVYYSAQIFLFGAEITHVYAHRCGSRYGEDAAPSGPPAIRRGPEA
ncbi:MAG: YihY/virulence factor BrkB family protein [Proteobacteria bacterium]|nr:YihY/virulence factor BrkB family protein [Pseudomonadota bacterium]